MTAIELGLLIGIIAHSVAIIMVLVKLTAWITKHITETEQKIEALEAQVNNDVTGRRVVGEMREDIAIIKTQLIDVREDIQHLRKKVDQ